MIEFVSDADIALIEHDVIKSMALLEGDANNDVWYLTGVHDMAEKLMQFLREKDLRRRESEGV